MTWNRSERSNAAKKGLLIGGVASVAAGVGAALFVRRRRQRFDMLDKVVVITGGSRGLGYVLAEECLLQGANVVICARDESELSTAKDSILRNIGKEVHTYPCDVSDHDQVREFVNYVISRFGRIDVLINSAGVITVGPVESQSLPDYEEAIDIMFWGVVYPTLAVAPHMTARRFGRIANITSIGGKVAVPHLVPYSAAKFAAVGLSEGLRAELLKDGVIVTTVCPGLMRTGSHLNAHFKGQHKKEFTWFSFGATLPFVSIDARRAAKKIINAIRNGKAELVITPQAKLAALFHGLFPGLTSDIMGGVNQLLPAAGEGSDGKHLGKDSQTRVTRSVLQKSGQRAAKEFNQEGRDSRDTA